MKKQTVYFSVSFQKNAKWNMEIDGHRRDNWVPTVGLWRLSGKVSKCGSIVQRCWHHVPWVLLIQHHSGHNRHHPCQPGINVEQKYIFRISCSCKLLKNFVFYVIYIFLTRYHKREWVCFMIRFVSVNIGLKTKVLKSFCSLDIVLIRMVPSGSRYRNNNVYIWAKFAKKKF